MQRGVAFALLTEARAVLSSGVEKYLLDHEVQAALSFDDVTKLRHHTRWPLPRQHSNDGRLPASSSSSSSSVLHCFEPTAKTRQHIEQRYFTLDE